MRAEAGISAARTARPDLEERRRAKARAARLRRLLVIGGSVAVLAIVLGIGIGFAGATDRIPAGVTIDGVDVSGLTAAQAKQVLEARADQLALTPVAFSAGDETFAIRPKRLGVAADWDAAIADALGRSDGFILFRGFDRLVLRINGADIDPKVAVNERRLDSTVARFAEAVDQKPVQASIRLDGLRPLVVPAKTGLSLNREAASSVILAALAHLGRGTAVPLPVDVAQPAVRAPDLAPAAAQIRKALSAPVAVRYRKTTLTLPQAEFAKFLVLPANGSKEVAVGGKAADAYFANLAKGLNRDPRDAEFELDGNGRVHIAPSGAGRELEVETSERRLLAAALHPTARTARLSVALTEPKITTEKAKGMGITGVVSSYTTTFGGDPSRIHNVELVSRLIDDHLIAPGEVFSFNQTTGERNASQGFLEAPVIINGELKTGIGGGVCQVSTTVFNAAFEAGLSIEERHNHALYIDHYPTGRDATVNYPDTDLKFTNDTGHWLWIRTFVDSSSLTVNLYGTPVDRQVKIETSPLKTVGAIPVKQVPDPNSYVGEKWVESAGQPARTVSVRRMVYDSKGKLMYDTTWDSYYVAEPKIVHVGTKPRPVPTEPAQTETDEASQSDTGGATTQDTGGETQTGTQPPAN